MMFQISTATSVAFAMTFASTIIAAPTAQDVRRRDTTCTGVSQVVVGEYCINLIGDTQDPDLTECHAYLQQLDNQGNILGNISIGFAQNEGYNNYTTFCADYDLVTGSKSVELTSCDDTWIYTMEDCKNGTSMYLIQDVDGATRDATMYYDTDISLPGIDGVGDWYNKFVVAESAFDYN